MARTRRSWLGGFVWLGDALWLAIVLWLAVALESAASRAGVRREPCQAQAYCGRYQPERDPAKGPVMHEPA